MSDEEPNVPKVSVIIPFYDREEFLAQAVESVVAQSYRDWEIILVDDGSEDAGPRIAADYVEKFPDKVSLVNHPSSENRGAQASRNLGLSHADGEFVLFLDSDDKLHEQAIEHVVKAFEAEPEVDCVCGLLECWYSWNERSDESDFIIDLSLELNRTYEPPALLLHNLRAGGSKPGIGSVSLRTEFAREYDVLGDDYRSPGEDQVFWARVSLNGRVLLIDKLLARYRQHPSSTSALEVSGTRELESMEKLVRWFEKNLPENYAGSQDINRALRGYRRRVRLESALYPLKSVYRSVFSLERRYAVRNSWIRIKRILLGPTHRQK